MKPDSDFLFAVWTLWLSDFRRDLTLVSRVVTIDIFDYTFPHVGDQIVPCVSQDLPNFSLYRNQTSFHHLRVCSTLTLSKNQFFLHFSIGRN